MQKHIFRLLVVLALPLSVFMSCGDEAQEAAEEANRDTVPVIETQPRTDSAKADSLPH